LNIGCGYGVIGISLAKKFTVAKVIGVDRDLLDVKYSNHNAKLSKVENFTAIPSLGIEAVKDQKFDLIISNIPAKINESAIEEEFIFAPLSILNEGGEYWVVIVNDLNRYFIKLKHQDKISLLEIKKRKGHIVYKLKPKNTPN
jgi:16S rRNA G1207 methylase RsmC